MVAKRKRSKGSVDDADAAAATSAADADDADDPIDNRGNYKGSDSELGALLKECFSNSRSAFKYSNTHSVKRAKFSRASIKRSRLHLRKLVKLPKNCRFKRGQLFRVCKAILPDLQKKWKMTQEHADLWERTVPHRIHNLTSHFGWRFWDRSVNGPLS